MRVARLIRRDLPSRSTPQSPFPNRYSVRATDFRKAARDAILTYIGMTTAAITPHYGDGLPAITEVVPGAAIVVDTVRIPLPAPPVGSSLVCAQGKECVDGLRAWGSRSLLLLIGLVLSRGACDSGSAE
jgi:hypothetical protein